MKETPTDFIDVARLRIGHYVFIDLGWLAHPFPVNRFRIHGREQIDAIRALGIERIRYSPELSDLEPDAPAGGVPSDAAAGGVAAPAAEAAGKARRRALLAAQRASLQACERQFGNAARFYHGLGELVRSDPPRAGETSRTLVADVVSEMLGEEESCIRLLSENVGERASLHAINVTVVSLLLGKACGMDKATLNDIGVGALLHDIGKIELPDRLRYVGDHQTKAEQQIYREHVAHGVVLARAMGLPAGVLLVIGEHHELADGSGFPQHLANDRISPAARIVGLVNRYDNLCNPANPAYAVTPHEALSQIFAQSRKRYDPVILGAFIRMMGVYPPGTVVELSDGRFALVVSVNSARPLKPRVIIHEPAIPSAEALVFDLEAEPALGIRRSLRPLQLPKATIDYLSPRQRICYYFERARDPDASGGSA